MRNSFQIPSTYTKGRHGQCQGWESRGRRMSGLVGLQWSLSFIERPHLKGVRRGGIVQDTWLLPLAMHAYAYTNAHTRAHILHSHNTINKLNINKFKRNSHMLFPARNNLVSTVILTFTGQIYNPGQTQRVFADHFSELIPTVLFELSEYLSLFHNEEIEVERPSGLFKIP